MGSFILNNFPVVVGSILIVMLILIFMSCIAKKHSILDRFVDKLSIIVGIFVATGVILTYNVFHRNLEQASIDTTFKIIDRAWINVNKEFHESYKSCPNLIHSLFFDWQIKAFVGENNYDSFKSDDEWHAVNYVTCLIFQSVEDMMTASSFDETDIFVWLVNCVSWFSSPILQKIWISQKPNYTETAVNLIDLVISKSINRKIKNVDDLKLVVSEIIDTDEYKKIISKRAESRDI
jgi:hypothetical protein